MRGFRGFSRFSSRLALLLMVRSENFIIEKSSFRVEKVSTIVVVGFSGESSRINFLHRFLSREFNS